MLILGIILIAYWPVMAFLLLFIAYKDIKQEEINKINQQKDVLKFKIMLTELLKMHENQAKNNKVF